MHCKQLPLLNLVALSCLCRGAEPPAIRLSAPSLGWVLSSDGAQAVEIAGIIESPRTGRTIALPSAARRSWASPDSGAVILRLDTGLFLMNANERMELLTVLTAGVDATAAWDRSSKGFAICWLETCREYAANGAIRAHWEVASASRALAFSTDAGLVTATAESAEWRRGSGVVQLDTVPVAAAFRAGTQELWLLDAIGHLAGWDRQGGRVGDCELVKDALGLVSSLDGRSFFAANAEGAAAVISLESLQTERFGIDGTVEGVWAAPGLFAIRLHQSVKRPIAFWNGETGVTGWSPAEIEVPQ